MRRVPEGTSAPKPPAVRPVVARARAARARAARPEVVLIDDNARDVAVIRDCLDVPPTATAITARAVAHRSATPSPASDSAT